MPPKRLHLHVEIIRRSQGQSAVEQAAYRTGTAIYDERRGKVWDDHVTRTDVVKSFILAPEGAPRWIHDRTELWRRALIHDKRDDAQECRTLSVALPRGLGDARKEALFHDFLYEVAVRHGMVADGSIHKVLASDGLPNLHGHAGLTMREIDGDGFSRRKNRAWNDRGFVERARALYEQMANRYLEEDGSPERVRMVSYSRDGLDIEPQRHLGPRAAAREAKGLRTETGDHNRGVRHRNEIRAILARYEASSGLVERSFEPPPARDEVEARHYDAVAEHMRTTRQRDATSVAVLASRFGKYVTKARDSFRAMLDRRAERQRERGREAAEL